MPGFDHFGFIAPWYDKIITNRIYDELIELAELPDKGRLLDIGGGTGRVAELLTGKVGQIEIVDVSMGMLRIARKKNLRTVCASTISLPYQAEKFSRILVIDALHHFNSQEEVIKEVWRVLEPGGMVIINEPNYDQLSGKMIRILEKVLMMNSHFLRDDTIVLLFRNWAREIRVIHKKGNSWIIIYK